MKPETLGFFEKVYEVVRLIPYGRVTSYGAIAKYLGATKSARIVGYAMNASHTKDVPAHRVVNRKGLLTGKHHFEGTNLMQQLLENEGVEDGINHYFNENLYKNAEDLFEKKNSERQFYTVPATTVPNDQIKFAEWLWKEADTCKYNGIQCLEYEDIRFH